MISTRFKVLTAALLTTLLSSCDSGGNKGQTTTDFASGASLQSVEYGRLVDIYAYRRIEATNADRRASSNRKPVLVAENVVVRPDIETESLFNSTGDERITANFRFMPFDVEVGHEELLILWDDTIPPERERFQTAMKSATTGLPLVSPAFREQNTSQQPMPVVPRNAAICLTFSRDIGKDGAFFRANPSAIQVLEFINPRDTRGRVAFRPVPVRVLPVGNRVILDTSVIGGEASGGLNTPGLPASENNVSANIRIALPTTGVLSKALKFAEDPIANLNGSDADGEQAVIRDFRSGNLADGKVGALADVEPPVIVGDLKMGIIGIDSAENVLTINKRSIDAAIRGRIPYVDGALDPNTGLASGPVLHPLATPLRSGDIIYQTVTSPIGELVRIRAEVVMNLDVGNTPDDPEFVGLGMYRVGSDPSAPADGGQDPIVRIKVTNLTATDSEGNVVSFRSSNLPLGEDCTMRVHYYQNVPYKLAFAKALDRVSDAARLGTFMVFDPAPPRLDKNRQPNSTGLIDPTAAVALRFSEPMNIETVEAYENFLLSTEQMTGQNFMQIMSEPKTSTLSMVAARLLDGAGDGTLLQLRPPVGLNHEKGKTEQYYFHMMLGAGAPADMAGNRVDVFDRRVNQVDHLSVAFTLDEDADTNAVGWRVHRFASLDEDGSGPGSADAFGQFQLIDGELRALPTTRTSAIADPQTLSGIERFTRGECDVPGTPFDPGPPEVPATPPSTAPFGAGSIPGVLYQCTLMIGTKTPPGIPIAFQPPQPTVPQTEGGISEPHNQRGSRLQMTYREDDFGLAYTDATQFMLDVEQMHWSPFNDREIRTDVFDRYSLRMAHSDWRPDLDFILVGDPGEEECVHNCFSGRSGLRANFDSNVLEGSSYVTMVKDARYEMSPTQAFRSATGTKFHPYPAFERTYTWRDSRLVRWDPQQQRALGLGGAHQPTAPTSIRDYTASISSPFVPDKPRVGSGLENDFRIPHLNGDFVLDYGDFSGRRTRDHDPIALPLLLDFAVYPDGPANGGSAQGVNQFQIALVGPCWSPLGPGGYYTSTMDGCTTPWPQMRAHTSGGVDQITQQDILVQPDVTANAQASVIKDFFWGDLILGLWRAPERDGHLHWAQIDFVRRVSMVTFGFFDTQRPNAHLFSNQRNPLNSSWPGKATPDGIPNFEGNLATEGIKDFVTLMDPPLSRQPVGTSVVVEFRGVQDITAPNNAPTSSPLSIFNQPDDFDPDAPNASGGVGAGQAGSGWTSVELVHNRGNLLNPFYACEAYRYNDSAEWDNATLLNTYHEESWINGPRIVADGITQYVTEDRLDEIRQINGLLPRYMNYRIIMENNLEASPPISPKLRSFGVAYRMAAGN